MHSISSTARKSNLLFSENAQTGNHLQRLVFDMAEKSPVIRYLKCLFTFAKAAQQPPDST